MGSPWIHPWKGLTWEQSELLTDIEVVFNRTLSIIGSEEFDLHHLFSHELAPIPTSLFLDDGSMISASLKLKLKLNHTLSWRVISHRRKSWLNRAWWLSNIVDNQLSDIRQLLNWVNAVTAYVLAYLLEWWTVMYIYLPHIHWLLHKRAQSCSKSIRCW